MRSFFCIMSLLCSSTVIGQQASLNELIAKIDMVRAKFDRFYFECYQFPEYDKLATEKDWGNTPVYEWRKIGRDGIKRYSYKKIQSMPNARIKYSKVEMVSVFDGENSRMTENKRFHTQKEKSSSCEENGVFWALGWPENEQILELKDTGRVFVPQILKDDSGQWQLQNAKINEQDCYLVSSTDFGMRFWFAKNSKMPLKYEFKRNKFSQANKTVEFLDYKELDGNGMMFPQKILLLCDLYSNEGVFEGTCKVQTEITNCSVNPAPELFVLNPNPGDFMMEEGKSFIYYPNSAEFLEQNVQTAVSQTIRESFTSEYRWAWWTMAFAGGMTITVIWSIQKLLRQKFQAKV